MKHEYSQAFCTTLGFNSYRRNCCLAIFELDPERDQPLAEALQAAVIRPHIDAIVDAFYVHLLAHEIYKSFLENGKLVEGLKASQRAYLLNFGVDFASERYFEERLRVGMAHKRVGLPVALYQGAYRKLMQILVDTIPDDIDSYGCQRRQLESFISRMTAFDMSLAIETYHIEQLQDLEQSLAQLRTEGAALRDQVSIDTLTGVYTRDHILKVFSRGFAYAREKNSNLGVAMVDLDRFKQINDNYGHITGDKVLKQVGKRMQHVLRDTDFVGRYGGEEFMLVLCSTDLAAAEKVVERLREHIASTPIKIDDETSLNITLSGGVTKLREGDTETSVIQRADKALYEAKRSGRNIVLVK
ncbi:MAG: diguanylate cyclase [Granulosicoccaceae bacterium]|jgi:diguanylate cyclase (GGDEF)-like protein